MYMQISRAELARQLGVSRTYVTLLAQGKRTLSQQLVNKLGELMLTHDIPIELTAVLVGKRGLEPRCLSAHDPKSCLSASCSTCPETYPDKVLSGTSTSRFERKLKRECSCVIVFNTSG